MKETTNPFLYATWAQETAGDDGGPHEYRRARLPYPAAAVNWLIALLGTPGGEKPPLLGMDVGAGTGQLTLALAEQGLSMTAVEPSPAMRIALTKSVEESSTNGSNGSHSHIEVIAASAENLPAQDGSVDLVTWAESLHWTNQDLALAEATRVLRPGGVAAVLGNQLDVTIPWVHRLSRIMRSGDVLHLRGQPRWPSGLQAHGHLEYKWDAQIDLDTILALGRTRSSYLQAGPAGQEKMQNNLRWYWLEHLGYDSQQKVLLPQRTFGWAAKKVA